MPHIHRSIAAFLFLAVVPCLHAQEELRYIPAEHHEHPEALEVDVAADRAVLGRWRLLDTTMPINPVHLALMHTGKVLVVAGSGNKKPPLPPAPPPPKKAAVWDPATENVTTFDLQWDMFCNGMVVLPDGRPFVFGGTIAYPTNSINWKGSNRASIYPPGAENFDYGVPNMRRYRWYPTGTVLGDGRVMVFSGQDERALMTREVEIYKPSTNSWSFGATAEFTPPWYPRQHLLPSGKVFLSGWEKRSRLYDPAGAGTWVNGPLTKHADMREYGTSVLLPLTPANGYKPAVMIIGGNDGSAILKSTEIIDLSGNPGQWEWTWGPDMKKARVQLNATILPNGKVLVSGGSERPGGGGPVLDAELFDPNERPKTFHDAAKMHRPRLYHSNTLLLPDGRVLAVGSNPGVGYDSSIEIYAPPYLFTSTGALAPRPRITSASATVTHGNTLQIQTPQAAAIGSVVLIRAGAPTHAFDMEQRLVGLTFTAGSGVLNATLPMNPNLLPPGYYLLFILDTNGVPSVGKFVKVVSRTTS